MRRDGELRRSRHRCAGLLALAVTWPACLFGQENYEIQVYGSETVPPGVTRAELHSNFTGEGRKERENGVLPTHHAFHETVEITHGFTPWFETGFYLFTSARSGDGWQWVGDHIRPRIRVPEEWQWPVGLSLSMEIGYQERKFSEDTWSVEIRPIIDRQLGPWYLSFNPVIEKSLRGVNSGVFEFSPSAKVGYDVTEQFMAGVEYYASLGPVTDPVGIDDQEHLIFPAIDYSFLPGWELNVGVGFGLTDSTDDLIVKVIIGRRF